MAEKPAILIICIIAAVIGFLTLTTAGTVAYICTKGELCGGWWLDLKADVWKPKLDLNQEWAVYIGWRAIQNKRQEETKAKLTGLHRGKYKIIILKF